MRRSGAATRPILHAKGGNPPIPAIGSYVVEFAKFVDCNAAVQSQEQCFLGR